MFRNLYKEANDAVKGDRAILDKAFLQAAQPVKKKSPVIKYSFIGTAVAAVMVLGAVFANPSVFTNRSEEIGKLGDSQPTEVVNATEAADVSAAKVENTVVANVEADEISEEDEVVVNVVAPKKRTETNTNSADAKVNATAQVDGESGGGGDSAEDDGGGDSDEDVPQEDYGIAVMSLDGEEDDTAYEAATEEAAAGFSLRDRNAPEEATEKATEYVEEDSEEVTESAKEVLIFSYMYDKSVYTEGEWGVKTEGFVNTDVSPVTTGEAAIERAKAECTVEYDTTRVYHDPIEKIWMVNFSMNMPGGDQSVYMDANGVTQMIVYGE